jgi:predicted MFS family arabinose efflux permease
MSRLLAPLTGYLSLFVLDAITSYFVALIVYAKLPEKQDVPNENLAQTLSGYKKVLQDHTVMIVLLFSLLITTAYLQMFTTLSLLSPINFLP